MPVVKGISAESSKKNWLEPRCRSGKGATINLTLGFRGDLTIPKARFLGLAKYSIGSVALPLYRSIVPTRCNYYARPDDRSALDVQLLSIVCHYYRSKFVWKVIYY